jgi:hypothetical protein
VFRSGTTRILELIVLPGDTSLFHSHEDPIVYINLSSGALRTQELGKDWSQPGGRGGARTGSAGAPAAAPAAPVAPSSGRSRDEYDQLRAGAGDAPHQQHRHRHRARARGGQPDQGHRRHTPKDAGSRAPRS